MVLYADLIGTNQCNGPIWLLFIIYINRIHTYCPYSIYPYCCLCACDAACAVMHGLLPQAGSKQNLLCEPATVTWLNLDMPIRGNNPVRDA